MKRTSTWIGMGLVAVLTVVSAVAFADFGSSSTGIQNIEIAKDPPGQQECICPLYYEPVVCRAADGTRHSFSNLCFAGCAGFEASDCARVDVIDRQ